MNGLNQPLGTAFISAATRQGHVVHILWNGPWVIFPRLFLITELILHQCSWWQVKSIVRERRGKITQCCHDMFMKTFLSTTLHTVHHGEEGYDEAAAVHSRKPKAVGRKPKNLTNSEVDTPSVTWKEYSIPCSTTYDEACSCVILGQQHKDGYTNLLVDPDHTGELAHSSEWEPINF